MSATVISGMGIVWHDVRSLDEYWQALADPPNPTPLDVSLADADALFDHRETRRSTAASRILTLAGLRAMSDAGLGEVDPSRAAVVIGAGFDSMDWDIIVDQAHLYAEHGAKGLEPLSALTSMPNLGAALLAQRLGWSGPSFSVGSGCTSSLTAICVAEMLVRSGTVDVAVAGGAAYVVDRYFDPRETLRNLRVHSSDGVSRPFSDRASGFVHSSGAACVVLESHAHAERRGKKPHGRIVGASMSTDVSDLVAPGRDGAAFVDTYRAALRDAGCSPDEVALVNPHGSGTPNNDDSEAVGIVEVFGEHQPLVAPSKPATGHLASGAGAAELIATVLMVERGVALPTAHVSEAKAGSKIRLVVGSPAELPRGFAITSNLGLGGHHAAVVLAPESAP